LETLETKALLTASGLNESALITLGDVIEHARESETIPLRLTADRLSPGARGWTSIEIEVQPTADSPFRAGRFQLIAPSGEVVKVSRFAQGRAMAARARIAPGDYLLRVRGRGASTGAFVAQVRLVADLNADRQVNREDLELLKARRGGFQAESQDDLSGDGRLDRVDRRMVRRNFGAASRTITIQVVNHTGDAQDQNAEFSDDQIHIAAYGKVPNLADPTHNPDGWAYFDATGQAQSLWGPNGAFLTVPTFTLADAPNGIELPRTQTVVSGQVYFGLGAPPVLHVNTGVTALTVTNGGSGYSETNPPIVVFGGGTTATATLGGGTVTTIQVVEGGSGYTSAPTVLLTGGGGSGATAVAEVQGGQVKSISITAPGSGYSSAPQVTLTGGGGVGAGAIAVMSGEVGEITVTYAGNGVSNAPTVTLGGGGGTGATAQAVLTNGAVTAIFVENGGSGYTSESNVTLTGGGGSGATASLSLANGIVTSIAVANAGSGYTTEPTVTIVGGGGSGATATAQIANGVITGFTITGGGSGYVGPPNVQVSGGGGQGGSGLAIISGAIAAIQVVEGGSGYTAPPTVTISGGTGAVATALIGSVVTTIDIIDPGAGYTLPPTVFLSDGSGATATATVANEAVQSFTVTNNGNNYATPPLVTIVGGGGSGATATATVAILGVAAPSPSNASDPGNSVYWDFAEFTLNSSTNPDNINADLSQVDLIGIPHTLQVVSRDGTQSPLRGVYPARDEVFTAYASFLTTQSQPDFLPLLTETGIGNHGPFRILAPSDYVLRHIGDPQLPSLATYYDDYIGEVFTLGNSVTYQVPTPSPTATAVATAALNGDGVGSVHLTNVGGGYLFPPEVSFTGGGGTGATGEAVLDATTGTITGVTVTNPGSGYTSPPAVAFSDPVYTFQGIVTTLDMNGPVVYQFKQQGGGDATTYNVYSPLNPPPWTQSSTYATWMVFANGGVFADSQQQYPNDPAKAAILANIENQLVSSMSRGVAVTPGPFYPKGGIANWYAAFLHQTSISIDGLAYGFAYDDQGGKSTDLSVNQPRKFIITIGWRSALPTS
jgi:hypothetical protein